MVKWFVRYVFAVLCLIGVSSYSSANAQTVGTPEQAKQLVEKTEQFYKANGRDKTLAAVTDKNGGFVDGDLYIFAYSEDGVIIGHGGNPALVGKNFWDMKDTGGVFFAREFIKTAGAKPEGGWVDYSWVNPNSKKIETKQSFVKKIGENLIVGCGAYKK